jgi:hypothetical protein
MIGMNPIVIGMVSRACITTVNRAQAQVLQVESAWFEFPYISAGPHPLPEHIRVVHRGVKRQDELLRSHGTCSAREVWIRKPKVASRLVGFGRS